ncbi:DUF6223 family protein [Streptomyces sp. Da 82-17]|uniref:DUF6223 family protein n=1 Tax=Streptomyces sp. Da 82-17 TaxID=3377116 RepID=UPI0038D3FE1C
MDTSAVLTAAAEGGIIGDGRTGANLALGVGFLGLALGWFAARARGAGSRTYGRSAVVLGLVGAALAVLHLATSSGGPGTGNGLVGAVVAVPLGLGAVWLGVRAPGRARGQARRVDGRTTSI